jgi:hypothetical protein
MALFPLGILSAAGVSGFDSDYELISTTIISGSSTTSVTFDVTGLGSTYKHLQVRAVGRTARASFATQSIRLRFNGDTSNIYTGHYLAADGSTVGSGYYAATSSLTAGFFTAATATANVFGVFVMDILDSFSTSKNKTIRSAYGIPTEIALQSGFMNSTSAISSISFEPSTAVNFVAGTRFSLYGIKG